MARVVFMEKHMLDRMSQKHFSDLLLKIGCAQTLLFSELSYIIKYLSYNKWVVHVQIEHVKVKYSNLIL